LINKFDRVVVFFRPLSLEPARTRVLKTNQPIRPELLEKAKTAVITLLNGTSKSGPLVDQVQKAWQLKSVKTGITNQETLFKLRLTETGRKHLDLPAQGFAINNGKDISFFLTKGPHCTVCHSTNHTADACLWTTPSLIKKLLGEKNPSWNLYYGGSISWYDAELGMASSKKGKGKKKEKRPRLDGPKPT
jgi:hypothetical protein